MKWPKLLNLYSSEEEKGRIYLRDFNFIESRIETVRYNQDVFDRFIDKKDYRLNLVEGYFFKVL
ncbi:MAG: hypothetical protein EBU90_30420 [Proteobacteria bacterium]|nr:hypothetical protein [Pseudomonadota bacterium]